MIISACDNCSIISLGKKVIEIYPMNVHRGWLHKWENDNYRMICRWPGELLDPQVIEKTIKAYKWDSLNISSD